jgi:eukaryotic-like serine/threonine-protein kinase
MASTPAGGTLILPQRGGRTSGSRDSERELPDDLLRQAASRLHILALLYAFVFFMADYFPDVLFPERRAEHLSRAILWAPGVIAIAVALLFAAVARSPRLSLPAVMNAGLAFEIVGSYGIAASEFLGMMGQRPSFTWFGLSWVSVWTLLFTVVVPTPPRRAVLAALASVSAVPAIAGLVLGAEPGIYFWLVFPYLLVVVMAYVGARVVYALGTEISRTRELGSYRLVERLGQGGMGEVWRAQHRMLARPAAIKLIRPSLTADARSGTAVEMRRRFEREAQVIASLRSPHTVNLFDFGVASSGAFYYVMELLEGLDAETLVRRFGPLPFERAIHVLRQVCHSLSEADAQGLVHRDIKPANVFLCHYGEEFDFVKVLDFGLVTALDDRHDGGVGDLAITREHSIQGTPAFIAPEQALGQGKLDGRADIYATGCVAYWLLTGQLVFTADTPMALLMKHVHTVPDPPSARIETRIPAALDQLVLACLAKDPADRPQSAKELSRRLAEVEGADGWTEVDAREWWVAHPLPAPAERAAPGTPPQVAPAAG